MSHFAAYTLLSLLSLTELAFADGNQNIRDLMSPPADTLEAQRVRIWVPVEHEQTCLVNVTITDSSAKQVREIISRVFPKSYYNFYWDKKDDSGRFVAPGVYKAIIDDYCGGKRSSRVEAYYQPGENSGDVFPSGKRESDSVVFVVFVDSAIVSVEVTNRVGRSEEFAVRDSVIKAGSHTFRWRPDLARTGALYNALITIDGYTRTCPFRYKK